MSEQMHTGEKEIEHIDMIAQVRRVNQMELQRGHVEKGETQGVPTVKLPFDLSSTLTICQRPFFQFLFAIHQQRMGRVLRQLAERLLLVSHFEWNVTLKWMHVVMASVNTGDRLKHSNIHTGSIPVCAGRSLVQVTSDLGLSSFHDTRLFVGQHGRNTRAHPGDELLVG
jgi:hypothetical protein